MGPFFFGREHIYVRNRNYSLLNSLLFNLTLCWFSMCLICCVKGTFFINTIAYGLSFLVFEGAEVLLNKL